MKKRSNFTPMKRFHEILDNYGLKLMEVGTNHLRVFFGNRKLFDYYPLRMKRTSATEPAEMRKESNKTFPLPWPARYFNATMMA